MVKSKIPNKFARIIKKDVNFIVNLNIDLIDEISLFGSCSRNECRYNSDIDLLVITKGERLSKSTTGYIRGELEYIDDTNVTTDVVFYDRDVFNSSKERIVDNMKNDKIVLWRRGEYTDEYKGLL
jgi:predicted nucleotidyltransferase